MGIRFILIFKSSIKTVVNLENGERFLQCVEDYKRMLKRKRTYEKRPKGFAINVYDTNGNISSRRVFERLSSSEAEDLHLDYEGAYKFVKESRFDWQTESDFLIWR